MTKSTGSQFIWLTIKITYTVIWMWKSLISLKIITPRINSNQLILQDGSHFAVETLMQHGKRNQIFRHHCYSHICSLSRKICKEKTGSGPFPDGFYHKPRNSIEKVHSQQWNSKTCENECTIFVTNNFVKKFFICPD